MMLPIFDESSPAWQIGAIDKEFRLAFLLVFMSVLLIFR